MVETQKTEPPSYDVAVECLEELESMLTTTAIKIEETPVGKHFGNHGLNLYSVL